MDAWQRPRRPGTDEGWGWGSDAHLDGGWGSDPDPDEDADLDEGWGDLDEGEGSGSTAGSGEPLRRVRRRDVLHRMLYTIEHPAPEGHARPGGPGALPGPGGPAGLGGPGRPVRYTVEIDAGREDGHAALYADGRQRETAAMPAAFGVPGGVIEVDVSLYGVRRVHLRHEDGREQRLHPVPGTLEHRRGRLHRRHPLISRGIAGLAVAVLLLNLVLAVPQGLELITGLPRIAELFGTFTSPVALPAWLNTVLLLAGVAAAVERVLTLRSNRVIDFETLWTSV